jgi:hypothetical protein
MIIVSDELENIWYYAVVVCRSNFLKELRKYTKVLNEDGLLPNSQMSLTLTQWEGKVKLSLYQAVEAHVFVSSRGSHIF